MSLPLRGAWIEISYQYNNIQHTIGRSPCGERGLKYKQTSGEGEVGLSLPLRGAWIEIFQVSQTGICSLSLPLRGAWIEIRLRAIVQKRLTVAPLAGSVD